MENEALLWRCWNENEGQTLYLLSSPKVSAERAAINTPVLSGCSSW